MTYKKKFPLCPYRAKGSSHCSHKSCADRCIYNNPEKCDKYNEIAESRKYPDNGGIPPYDPFEIGDDL